MRSKKPGKINIVISDTARLYPPLWGGPKRIWNLFVNFSSELFDFTYIGIDFQLKKNKKYDFNTLRNNFKEILCGIPLRYYFWHAFEKIFLKNTSLDLFIYLWMHTNRQFITILNSQDADLIICSHPWSSPSVQKKDNQIFIYDAHNCEYLLMEQVLEENVFKKFILRKVKKIESDACRKSDLILVCSENEKNDFVNLYGIEENKFCVIPNGAINRPLAGIEEKKIAKIKLGMIQKKLILFIGTFYKPNIEAAGFIIDNLAPKLREYDFFVVGSVKEGFKNMILPENVKFAGRVSEKDLNLSLTAADLAINPMFSGSGINIKMLDYLAYGLPTVTSPCGSRGLEIENMKHAVVNNTNKFDESIKEIFANPLLYDTLRQQGHRFAIENYNWESISKKLENKILSLKNKVLSN